MTEPTNAVPETPSAPPPRRRWKLILAGVILLPIALFALYAAVATDLQHEVRRVGALLCDWPGVGHKAGTRTRAFGLTRFPYQLVYRLTADALVIVAIAHEKRDPRYWRGRI